MDLNELESIISDHGRLIESGGVDGKKANLSSVNLENIDLCECNLSDANISNANLDDSNLSEGYFKKTLFKGCSLVWADLSQAYLMIMIIKVIIILLLQFQIPFFVNNFAGKSLCT